jgi:hypothetical protein
LKERRRNEKESVLEGPNPAAERRACDMGSVN